MDIDQLVQNLDLLGLELGSKENIQVVIDGLKPGLKWHEECAEEIIEAVNENLEPENDVEGELKIEKRLITIFQVLIMSLTIMLDEFQD